MKKNIKKRNLTLLEIMIVIFLITLITGVIGYNMKGSLDKGKVFKTRQAKEQLHDMLLLGLSEGKKMDDILASPKKLLIELGLAKDPEKLLLDGWNDPFVITANARKNDFKIHSKNLQKFEENQKNSALVLNQNEDEDE